MKKYEDLKNLVNGLENDIQKFNSGNAAAGTRIRKGLQEIKKMAQDMRLEVQEKKNSSK